MTFREEGGRPSPPAVFGKQAWDRELRRTNLGRLLIRAFDHFEDRIVAGIRERGFEEFRASDTGVLRSVDLEGTRVSEIARRARVTPQAVSQAVAGLEERGLVKTAPDPDDGRARLVRFTERGRELILAGQETTEELYREWEEIVGQEGLNELRQHLVRLVLTLDGAGRR